MNEQQVLETEKVASAFLIITNDGQLYKSRYEPIEKRYIKFLEKGEFSIITALEHLKDTYIKDGINNHNQKSDLIDGIHLNKEEIHELSKWVLDKFLQGILELYLNNIRHEDDPEFQKFVIEEINFLKRMIGEY